MSLTGYAALIADFVGAVTEAIRAAGLYADQVAALGRAIGDQPAPAAEPALTPAELEAAYRRYARRYNLSHPGRRVSWRRLSRPQRAAAIAEKETR